MRLDKFLTECNIGSRSEVKKIIKKGLVTVNGNKITDANAKINEDKDEVFLDNKRVCYEKYQYFLLHKPAGCVTATKDNLHATVMEYLPEEYKKDCSPVGRLDIDTEGLLLITNDGKLAHNLLSPRHHVDKTYYATLSEPVGEEAVNQFKAGVDIGDDTLTLPADLEILSEDGKEILLTICEGRFHQVKRMFEAVGSKVTYLKRVSMGSLSLEGLDLGQARRLTDSEIAALKDN